MKTIDEIIAQEQAQVYVQRNKELFSYYALSLIASEQAERKLKRVFRLTLVALTICVAAFFAPLSSFWADTATGLGAMTAYDLGLLTLVSYALAGACLMALMGGKSIFR
jgi:hypothetical protein